MATVIDITNKIKNEEKFIVYNGKSYKVDDRKNTIVQVYSIIDGAENASVSMIDQVMELLLGKNAVKDFTGFAYEDYLVPFFAAMACVQNKSYEEIESSFRKSI
jgi:hypothetical protein